MFWNSFVSVLAAVGIMGAIAPSYSDSYIPAALQLLDNAAQQLDEHKEYQEHISKLAQSLVMEARSQGLGKFEGFSDTIMKELKETSKLTAAEQLKMVLQRILDREDMKRRNTKTAVQEAVKDLDEPESTISTAMAEVEPLQYTKK
ncbi:uncharacterized protein ImpE3 [Anabrus simplex]|uniref:uncharacterized protein ImpE3 n=1 Tax=Anabrus simplex TaxID=316456 RepID=UPI0035A31EA3